MSGGAYLHPSGLTPNLGALNLLNTTTTTGGARMEHPGGYGSGCANIGIAGMQKLQPTDNKLPKKQWKKRTVMGAAAGASAGTAVKVKPLDGSVDDPYYSTGLTPANNDSPPLDLTNGNTPLSEIGDLNMSSVFSPSLFASPRYAPIDTHPQFTLFFSPYYELRILSLKVVNTWPQPSNLPELSSFLSKMTLA